jgi:hypothetical protein
MMHSSVDTTLPNFMEQMSGYFSFCREALDFVQNAEKIPVSPNCNPIFSGQIAVNALYSILYRCSV